MGVAKNGLQVLSASKVSLIVIIIIVIIILIIIVIIIITIIVIFFKVSNRNPGCYK